MSLHYDEFKILAELNCSSIYVDCIKGDSQSQFLGLILSIIAVNFTLILTKYEIISTCFYLK